MVVDNMNGKLKVLFSCLAFMGLLATGCSNEKKVNSIAASPIELNVSAAASMANAMKEIGENYENKNPNVKVVLNFASSGALQQAINQGAPTDLFISAAQDKMDILDKNGLLEPGTRIDLLENKIVLIVPKDSKLQLSKFEDVLSPEVKKIGLGEPKSVPAGQYAAEVFKSLGILDEVNAKAVFGSSVRQVLSWVDIKEVDAGVVYATDAVVAKESKIVCTAPEGTHKPVVYPMAIIKGKGNLAAAKTFVTYLTSEDTKKVFEKYGFTVK